MSSVLTKLSDKAYWAMRKAMVKEVYDSEDHSIACVAIKHKISPSTLWHWCGTDLGPKQRKWLIEKSHKIRGKRKAANHKKSTQNVMFNPDKDPVLKIAAPCPVTGRTIKIAVLKTKPWDKKKARIAAEQAIALPGALKALGITEEVTSAREVVHTATVKPTLPSSRKLLGATVIINLDEHGKFLKYEVTGDASVQVYTRNK